MVRSKQEQEMESTTECSKRFRQLDYMCDVMNCHNLFHQNCAVPWEVSKDYEGDEQTFCMFCHLKSDDALKDVGALPLKNNNPTHLYLFLPLSITYSPANLHRAPLNQ